MSANYPGVYETTHKDGSIYYRASITFRGKHISLGSFDDAQDAYVCYLEAESILTEPANAKGVDCDKVLTHLAFEKYVTLINFKDNSIYIGNPIYVYARYFQYYISPQTILKFDTDNLFYFASHKIMQRGNRLFVADFGMQLGVLSRFGIRAYAVEGKDYRFINGDHHDLRYENIDILNPYHGVSPIKKKNKLLFKTKIHIRSSYVVGIYASAIEAAIAYNKATDILRKRGFTKAFQLNEIEHLSAKEYANIYMALPIADTIYSLSPDVPVHS